MMIYSDKLQHWYEKLKRWQLYLVLALYTGLGLAPNPGQVFHDTNDLLLHFSGYVVAGISMGLAKSHWHHWQRFAFLLCYSLIIEIIQEFIPNRGFDVRDLCANGAGILFGLLIYQVIARPIDRAIYNVIAPNRII